MNKKGFSLLELLAVFVVLILIFMLSIPIVIKVINKSRLNSYKISSSNVLDTIEYYLTQNQDVKITENGIEINNIDKSILKNNDFDSGTIIRDKNDKLELVNLKKGDYCSKGTKDNLKVTDKGCGALDETSPTKSYVFFKTSDNNSITVVGQGYDPDSNIISYELSVDNSKYIKNADPSYNVFNISIDDSLEHSFKIRVTNEAGKTLESDVKFFKKDYSFLCENDNNSLKCPSNKDYLYSTDLINWQKEININLLSNQNYYVNTNNNYHLISINNIDLALDGSTPILDDNMIPVIFDEKKQKWIKVNPNTKYYDYENKIWANAVIVRKNKDYLDSNSKDRNYYLSDEAIYQEIYENDIIGFYVWIPRYSYKLWNVNGNNNEIQNIDIVFKNKNKTDDGLTDGIQTNGVWYTHKAFSYNEEISGFWVSKYLMSADASSSCYAFQNVDNCNVDTYNIFSLPNVNSLANIDLLNAYNISNKMNQDKNIYGFSSDTDIHIPTNLEWGSVLYLTSSKYGNINSDINSSTGNETGIFFEQDKYEMVMANYRKKNGKIKFEVWPNYIDYYDGITNKSRILGDATLETEKWYDNNNKFVNVENPYVLRGGKNIFLYDRYDGSASDKNYFRTILYVNK